MPSKPISTILKEARELIRDPKKWCKHWLWNFTPHGEQNCARGAIQRVVAGNAGTNLPDSHPTIAALNAVIPHCPRAPGQSKIARWNNSKKRTHGEIIAMLTLAAERAEADEQRAAGNLTDALLPEPREIVKAEVEA